MSGKASFLFAALGLVTAAVVVPASRAGADSGCVAWGSLPSHVALAPQGVTVHTTLRGTTGCAGVTADNGATAMLRGPVRRSAQPMRWLSFGDRDQATFYPTLDRPGTYRLVNGKVQSYDANYELIPATWHSTTMTVKYAGRFAGVTRSRSGVTATLEYYGSVGWRRHSGVAVGLQEWTAGGWRTLATTHSASSGRVEVAVHTSANRTYRLVSATTPNVWTAGRRLAPSRA